MWDVCFSQSFQGSLLVARKESTLLSASKGVLCPALGLSEGDIEAPLLKGYCPRKEHIGRIFRHYASVSGLDEAGQKELSEAMWTQCMADLEQIKAKPDKLRIWTDRMPDTQCGLRFLAGLLKGCRTEISLMELPESICRDDGSVTECFSWGEVPPEALESLLHGARLLSAEETAALAREWQRLKEENAPLRIYENGAVKSCAESYYDDKIRRQIPREPVKAAYIIGCVLGIERLPAGEAFVAERIEQFIRSGELKVVSKGKNLYDTILCREPI